jgi:hypothetical protein
MPTFGFGAAGLVLLALWLFCIADVLTAADAGCRVLPKWGWLLLVLGLPEIGSLVWLATGRPQHPAPAPPVDPVADEEFRLRCRERAQRQREAAHRGGGE